MYVCPCCEFLTLSEKERGSFEICDVCGWEDDNVQYEDSSYSGGANKVCLNEAKKNFKLIFAIDLNALSFTRKPQKVEIPQKILNELERKQK